MKVPSSIRKATPRKAHRERSQLAERQHLGLLEKKKDYVKRAADFKSKKERLARLKERAAFRNKDEFYFGMINARTSKGVHIMQSRAQAFTQDELALLKTQDQNYINYQRSVNLKKIERLQGLKHIPDIEELDNNETEDADEGIDDCDNEDPESPSSAKTGKPKHTIFVDSQSEGVIYACYSVLKYAIAKSFDPISHFQTTKEHLNQRYNRLRISMDNVDEVQGGEEVSSTQSRIRKKLAEKKAKAKRELESREKREFQLRKLQMEMEMQKNLMVSDCLTSESDQSEQGKGSKRKVGVDKNGLPIYKWRAERKK